MTKSRTVILVGPAAAGKSTLLSKFQSPTQVDLAPTRGIMWHTLRYAMTPTTLLQARCADFGGQRGLWNLYPAWLKMTGAPAGIVFVLDSSDPNKFSEAQELLELVFKHPQTLNSSLLVLANKQDIAGALSADEILRNVNSWELGERNITVQETSALKNKGLSDAFTWIFEQSTGTTIEAKANPLAMWIFNEGGCQISGVAEDAKLAETEGALITGMLTAQMAFAKETLGDVPETIILGKAKLIIANQKIRKPEAPAFDRIYAAAVIPKTADEAKARAILQGAMNLLQEREISFAYGSSEAQEVLQEYVSTNQKDIATEE